MTDPVSRRHEPGAAVAPSPHLWPPVQNQGQNQLPTQPHNQQRQQPQKLYHRSPRPPGLRPLPSTPNLNATATDANNLLPPVRSLARDPTSSLREPAPDFVKLPTQDPLELSASPSRVVLPMAPLSSFDRNKRPSGHSRSMSNPFPSFFSALKKRHDNGTGPTAQDVPGTDSGLAAAGVGVRIASDVTDDNFHQIIIPPKRTADWRGDTKSSKDFATGTCMTCGSLMRWPRELDVFKCTICLTVNDLVRPPPPPSLQKEESRQHRSGSRGIGSPPKPSGWPRARSISLEHTKQLIRQSIFTFLRRNIHPSSEPRQPPSSIFPSNNPFDESYRPPPPRGGSSTNPFSRSREPPSSMQPPGNPALAFVFDQGPIALRPPPQSNPNLSTRSFSASHPERPLLAAPAEHNHRRSNSGCVEEEWKRIFTPLQDYINHCFSSFDCVNSSFVAPSPQVQRPPSNGRSHVVDAAPRRKPAPSPKRDLIAPDVAVFDLDPKLLLLGNFAENGLWWTGGQPDMMAGAKKPPARSDGGAPPPVIKAHRMDWAELTDWYSAVISCAGTWKLVYDEIARDGAFIAPSEKVLEDLEKRLLRAQDHARRVLLRATESLLKRPGRPLACSDDLRFLLIILENPLLLRNREQFRSQIRNKPFILKRKAGSRGDEPVAAGHAAAPAAAGENSVIIKRILGLISNASAECHSNLVSWFAKYPITRFVRTKEIASRFLTYRLLCQSDRRPEEVERIDVTAGLIPSMSAGRSVASLHAELVNSSASKKAKEEPKKVVYTDDWQIKAAARFLSLLFAANNLESIRQGDAQIVPWTNEAFTDAVLARGQMLPTSDFYNTLLDLSDLVADFLSWESRRAKFSFCQYPFLLSIWAKTQILEFDARRQMELKARDAFFDSIMSRRNFQQYLRLEVRRDCMVEDSLKAVGEVIGSGGEDIKKRLRISFKGEEGVDAGGLRKEWFLLLVREVFNPDHGMFVYDDESQYCYFNPHTFEASDQFFLVGVVLGLAIYNSTILDVALPPFVFRRLLASAPAATTSPSVPHQKPTVTYTTDDLQEFRPRLAKSLRQLLEYDGDVQGDLGLTFAIGIERYGHPTTVSLCPGGEQRPVTNANRREYVDLYVRYILETSVTKQFEPFKRGFWTVCGGNALTLFRPEEIELLVRGSDEALDISSLKAVAQYENWGTENPAETEPVIRWFWQSFVDASVQDQHKLLSFITGSDRVPATGAALLPIKISCLGDDRTRFPIARTCFNMLSLFRYESREQLESRLWRAVHESEGFGLK